MGYHESTSLPRLPNSPNLPITYRFSHAERRGLSEDIRSAYWRRRPIKLVKGEALGLRHKRPRQIMTTQFAAWQS